MVSKEQIVEALKECKDPELDANIVDIGLLYGISIDQSNNIKLTLTMTSPMCPVTSIILADVQLRLEKLEGVGKVEMDLVWDPLWSPDLMSDELKYRVA